MFRDVTVLIAEDDPAELALFRRWAEGATFNVITARETYEGVRITEDADILVLDITLLNGNAMPLLAKWVTTNRGPVLVVTGNLPKVDRSTYFDAGAWNVIEKPIEASEFTRILSNHGTTVLLKRRLAEIESKVKTLTRAVYGLALLVAALGGIEIVPKVIALLGGL